VRKIMIELIEKVQARETQTVRGQAREADN
jgi:hypothetical protein